MWSAARTARRPSGRAGATVRPPGAPGRPATSGQLGETRLFLMGALLMADELADAEARLAGARQAELAPRPRRASSRRRARRRGRLALEGAARPHRDPGRQGRALASDVPALEGAGAGADPTIVRRRVLLRLTSKATNPGDLNSPHRELSLTRLVVLVTRRPPGNPGPRGLKRPPRSSRRRHPSPPSPSRVQRPTARPPSKSSLRRAAGEPGCRDPPTRPSGRPALLPRGAARPSAVGRGYRAHGHARSIPAPLLRAPG